MTSFIALLRGVNVGGHKKVAMADLRAFAEEIGLGGPRTILQSGNLVFSSGATAKKLEGLLQTEAHRRLGLECDFLVRTAKEWHSVIERNPFPAAAKRDPSHLLVMALRNAPSASAVEALRAAIAGPEELEVDGREAFIVYPAGMGTSKLTGALIEKKLGTRGSARNWNTALKLAAML